MNAQTDDIFDFRIKFFKNLTIFPKENYGGDKNNWKSLFRHKVGLQTHFGLITQRDNRDITQLVGFHAR